MSKLKSTDNIAKKIKKNKKIFIIVFLSFIFTLLVILFLLTSVISRPHINLPVGTYFRIRLKVLIDDRIINFSENEFQTSTSNTDPCEVKLTNKPLYIENGKNQVLRIHWEGLTGGELLKYFGLNYIGGVENILGYRFDSLPNIIPVKINDERIPTPKNNYKLYIFKGNSNDYYQVNEQEFLYQDLELLLKKSKTRQKNDENRPKTILESLNVFSEELNLKPQLTEGQLNELNNLIGNIVIFIQENPPTNEKISEQFNNLEQLSSTVCSV